MGNYCNQMFRDKGNLFDEPSRSYIRNNTSVVSIVPNNVLPINPDLPNSTLTRLTPPPQLNKIVVDILARQHNIKPFDRSSSLQGVKLEPYELINKGIIYDGEWRNGLPHGYGQVIYINGGYFQGYFDNGVSLCNDGIFIYPDGTFYRGQIKDSSANGNGTLVYKNGQMVYIGTWLNDKPHGHGKQEYKDGSIYLGNFIEGVKQGTGKFRWADGSQYEGQFRDGYMHGQGILKSSNQQTYRGQFFRNKKQGKGILQSFNGIYRGQFVQNQKMGEGQFKFNDGRVFKGAFYNDLPQGYGTMRMQNGQIISGVWMNGQNIQIQKNQSPNPINTTPPKFHNSAVSVLTNMSPISYVNQTPLSKQQSIMTTTPLNNTPPGSSLANTMRSIMKNQN